MAALSADDFAFAIATADVKRLSAVKGLGKKTAEKIVLELHGKISAAEVLGASGDDFTPATQTAAPVKLSAMDEEAVSALMGLGFTRADSTQAVKKARDLGATTAEDVIMKALQGVEGRGNYSLAGVGRAHEDPLSSAAVRLYSPNKSNRRLRKLPRKRSIAYKRKANEYRKRYDV